jgi:hypothetical protein
MQAPTEAQNRADRLSLWIENAGRLINACDPEFRLARAGLETRLPPEFTHQK